MKSYTYLPIILFISLLFSSALYAQLPMALNSNVLGEDLYIPWDMEWGGNGQIFFTERNGSIKRLDTNSGAIKNLYAFSQVAEEQHSGLLGIGLHPQWPDSSTVFVAQNYYDADFNIFLQLLKFNYHPTEDTLSISDTIYSQIPSGPSTTGGALLIDSSGYIYLSMGDLDLGTVSQDSLSLNGKILRFNIDGSIPIDNPFPNNPVWSMGHRNPQGLALGKDGFYSCEHGTFNNDELNFIQSGSNYGWPLVSGECAPEEQANCDSLGLRGPMLTWTPPIAPAGLAFYGSNLTIPEWENTLLIPALRDESLIAVKLDSTGNQVTTQQTYLKGEFGRIRSILVSPEGRVFIGTSNRDSRGVPKSGDDKIIEVFPRPLSISPDNTTKVIQWIFNPSEREGKLILERKFHHMRFELVNMNGQIVYKDQLPAHQSQISIRLSALASGLYILRVYADDHLFQTKIPSY